MKETDNNIKSEKVRNIMGKIPSSIVATGNVIILLLLTMLCIGAYIWLHPSLWNHLISM